MPMLSPQQILDRLQQEAGRALTPQEIDQAKSMLPAGWENGVDQAALVPLITAAAQLRQSGPITNNTGVYGGQDGGPPVVPTSPTGVYGGQDGGSSAVYGGQDGGPPAGQPGGNPFPDFPTLPTPNLTNYTPGTYSQDVYRPRGSFTPPAPFSFSAYEQPTLEEAQNEPGYQFALDQGRKALENSAAAKGVLRTGGTLKDLFSWGDRFAEQNYGNVNNRKFQTWSANRDNAANAYAMNYGISKDTFGLNNQQDLDTFDRNALGGLTAFQTNLGAQERANASNNQNALDVNDALYRNTVAAFNPKFESAKLTFEDLYRRWKAGLDATTSIATAGAY